MKETEVIAGLHIEHDPKLSDEIVEDAVRAALADPRWRKVPFATVIDNEGNEHELTLCGVNI